MWWVVSYLYIITKHTVMLQRSEIGKKASKKARYEWQLNRVFVTPNNEHYSLIAFEKVGRSYHYVYEWVDCPDSIKEVVANTIRSKTELGLSNIINWIKALRLTAENK